VLRCRDAGFDCDAEIRGQSEQEVMNQAAEHAQKAHGMQVTPEVAKQISSLIRDEKSPQESAGTV
jgi:predicted small metal-binding protein